MQDFTRPGYTITVTAPDGKTIAQHVLWHEPDTSEKITQAAWSKGATSLGMRITNTIDDHCKARAQGHPVIEAVQAYHKGGSPL